MNSGTELRVLDVDETLTFKLGGMLIYLMRSSWRLTMMWTPKSDFSTCPLIYTMDIYLTAFLRALFFGA